MGFYKNLKTQLELCKETDKVRRIVESLEKKQTKEKVTKVSEENVSLVEFEEHDSILRS